ncbi:MAG: glutathione S-transferase N-terminal domain-containing protein, partial [Alphaproteobacteria bacterium]
IRSFRIMKLYTTAVAPNPRRVTIFLNEKGIDIPTIELDLGKSEHLTDEFAAKNPMARVPVLEMDDGTYLAESLSICRYFEEIQPEPPLFGVGARDKAEVDMWNRRCWGWFRGAFAIRILIGKAKFRSFRILARTAARRC